jgi:hypothetical protein
MKVARVDFSTTPSTLTGYTDEPMVIIKKSDDTKFSYATPLATGYTYQVIFNNGIDFDHLGIVPSHTFAPDDKGFVLRFPYLA